MPAPALHRPATPLSFRHPCSQNDKTQTKNNTTNKTHLPALAAAPLLLAIPQAPANFFLWQRVPSSTRRPIDAVQQTLEQTPSNRRTEAVQQTQSNRRSLKGTRWNCSSAAEAAASAACRRRDTRILICCSSSISSKSSTLRHRTSRLRGRCGHKLGCVLCQWIGSVCYLKGRSSRPSRSLWWA